MDTAIIAAFAPGGPRENLAGLAAGLAGTFALHLVTEAPVLIGSEFLPDPAEMSLPLVVGAPEGPDRLGALVLRLRDRVGELLLR